MSLVTNTVNTPFAGPTIIQRIMPITGGAVAQPPPCDPNYPAQHTQLAQAVAAGIVQANQAIGSGNPASSQGVFTKLANDSRALGRLEGNMDACAASPKSATDLYNLLAQNTSSLLSTEQGISNAWGAGQYQSWMTYRAKLQNYYRVVTAYQIWLARAQAASGPSLPMQVPGLPAIPILPGQASMPGVIPGMPAMTTLTPNVTAAIATTALAPAPFYKRAWFWGVVALVIGGGAFALLYEHHEHASS